MPTLYVSPHIEPLLDAAWELSQDLSDDDGWQIITPNRNAAQTLGVPAFSLQQLAQDMLNARSRQIAPPLVVNDYLTAALRQSLTPQDPEGMVRTWQPTIQAVL
ncbi:MAG: hypothetical protein RLZZ568_1957, partial [Cyanobacteriota bacterium]